MLRVETVPGPLQVTNMRYLALATDYDGTLASRGVVSEAVVRSLERLRASGRRLLLVTGRELDDLRAVFPRLDLFDRVLAENGALLYRPDDGSEHLLAEPPPASFVEALRARGVAPLSVGRVVVAAWAPHESLLTDEIRAQGLALEVISNKRARMVLPCGVDKSSGLARALKELGLAPSEVVGVGDAENDARFLASCGCAVTVANALPSLKTLAQHVTRAEHGEGVIELVDVLLSDGLLGPGGSPE